MDIPMTTEDMVIIVGMTGILMTIIEIIGIHQDLVKNRGTKDERTTDKYGDNGQNVDFHSKDKTEISEHKNKNSERNSMKDFDRADARNKLVGLSRDYDSEEDQQRERESQDYKKDYRRNPEGHKNDKVASHEELRGYDR